MIKSKLPKLKFAIIGFLVLLLALSPATPVFAQGLGHGFYGTAKIGGEDAEVGTVISAQVAETDYGSCQVTNLGQYALIVQGEIEDGATIDFYINGQPAETFPFHDGWTTQLDLAVEAKPEPEPEPPPTGGGGPSYIDVETDFCGVTGSFHIDNSGKVLSTQTAGCEDGDLTVTIEKNTIALDEDGKALRSLTIHEDTDPPLLPEGNNFIGLPFNLGPAGATFDPPLIFTWTYDPEDIPEGAAPEDLSIVYWDGSKWITLTGVVDTENYTVTAEVSHFTIFALVVPVVEPEPVIPEPEKPVVEEPVVEEPEPEPEVEEPIVEEPIVEEPVVEEPEVEEPEKPEVVEPEKPSYLWAYILAGVLAAVGLSWLWWWRRRRD